MKKLILLSLTFFSLSILPAHAALDMSTFQNLPISHEGRLKPLSGFSNIALKKLSGEKQIADLKSIDAVRTQ